MLLPLKNYETRMSILNTVFFFIILACKRSLNKFITKMPTSLFELDVRADGYVNVSFYLHTFYYNSCFIEIVHK